MNIQPIGIIHSPHRQASKTPIQSCMAQGIKGSIEIFPPFDTALLDLDGFERIWLLYWFDRSGPQQLVVTPYLDTAKHGVFATRSPVRPNPIGLSCVRLLSIKGRFIYISDLDVLDRTPLLDIKPYVPAFDCFKVDRVGWLTKNANTPTLADDRFCDTIPAPVVLETTSKTKPTNKGNP